MPRPRRSIPAYRYHKQTGRAVVSVYRADGSRTEIVLPGAFDSEESKAEYERILAQLRAGNGKMPATKGAADFTVAELVERFMAHAETYYVDPRTKEPTGEIWPISAAMRPLVRMYGDMPAASFGPLALQSLREAMYTGRWMTESEKGEWTNKGRKIGLARTTCNDQINRVRLLFRWAASQEIVAATVAHGLATVPGLRRGRSVARETEPVKPIASAVIDDTLPHLPPVVKDMVQVLLLTGMRVGELCIMRANDLDMSGEIWLYRPERHKGGWRDKERVIAIGPRAQRTLCKYLGTKIDAYLFRPAEQARIIAENKRAKRKTPVQPSQQHRQRPNPQRVPGDRFTPCAVNRAIRRACERGGIEHWHVHQLRHSASLAFSRELGLEHARAALGHATVDMSAMYAGHDLEAAKRVAQKVG